MNKNEETNKLLKGILLALVLKESSTEDKIRILCFAGVKSEEIGKLIGMTGRAVRNNNAYKEIK